MNARILQDSLVNDITKLFQKKRYKSPVPDDEMRSVTGIKQFLPRRVSEDDVDPFPYIIVRLDGGSIEQQRDAQKVAVLLLIGIFDDDIQNDGHLTVMEIIEQIQQHYEEKPALAGMFVMQDPINWALQDEESWPYFFGAMEMTWSVAAPQRTRSDLE